MRPQQYNYAVDWDLLPLCQQHVVPENSASQFGVESRLKLKMQ
jgi:hypothetical protein